MYSASTTPRHHNAYERLCKAAEGLVVEFHDGGVWLSRLQEDEVEDELDRVYAVLEEHHDEDDYSPGNDIDDKFKRAETIAAIAVCDTAQFIVAARVLPSGENFND